MRQDGRGRWERKRSRTQIRVVALGDYMEKVHFEEACLSSKRKWVGKKGEEGFEVVKEVKRKKLGREEGRRAFMRGHGSETTPGESSRRHHDTRCK
jgi:hypothetical protein